MMRKRNYAAIGLSVLVLGSGAFALWRSTTSSIRVVSKAAAYQHSSGVPTAEQKRELADALNAGDPLPDGWSFLWLEGNIEANPTKLIGPGGAIQYRVILKDETADVDVVNLYSDEVLAATATRANGKIVDTAGIATATLLFFVAPTGTHSYELEWIASNGTERTATLSVP